MLSQFSVNVFLLGSKSVFSILKLMVQTTHVVSNHKHNLSGFSDRQIYAVAMFVKIFGTSDIIFVEMPDSVMSPRC